MATKAELLEDNHIYQELWGMEVDENIELKKDLDDLIKTFYTWGISKKTYDGSDYTLSDEGYDTMNNLQKYGKKLAKKHRMYPYDQEIVGNP
jgi:hypothetical protein